MTSQMLGLAPPPRILYVAALELPENRQRELARALGLCGDLMVLARFSLAAVRGLGLDAVLYDPDTDLTRWRDVLYWFEASGGKLVALCPDPATARLYPGTAAALSVGLSAASLASTVEFVCSGHLAHCLVVTSTGTVPTTAVRPVPWLSTRQTAVLSLIAAGHTNREIADRLHLSLYTVKHHATSSYAKIGVSSRTQAVLWCESHGLPSHPPSQSVIDVPPAPRHEPHSPLTARELEVIDLIAGGRSNREVAELLFVSVNTIKTHIRNAYRKIGVERRTQAAAWHLDGARVTPGVALVSSAHR